MMDDSILYIGLTLLSVFTSFITAAMGIGGGVLLLSVLALILPPAALIPVHGLVQLGSNGNRALMTRQHIDWQMFLLFAGGAILGAILASFVVIQLPLELIQLSVALFILYLVWGAKPKQQGLSNYQMTLAGGFTTLVSMFVGATGPLVAGFVHRQNYEKLTTTATFAACMSLQHLLKMAVFTLVGFAFWQWLPLIALMIMGGFVGTWLGLRVLHKFPTDLFRKLFKLIITLLAAKLLWQVLTSL